MDTFPGMPFDASANGGDINQLMWWVHALMAVLFIGWALYFVYVLFRFRAGAHPKANYEGSKSKLSTYIEVGVAVIEAVLLIGYAVPAWALRVGDFPETEQSEQIRVVAQQFAWNVHYPGADGVFGRTDPALVKPPNYIGLDPEDPFSADDIQRQNQLHVPVDKPVVIYLSTLDVIHSFFLPEMRVKQDTIPGMVIPIWFEAAATTPIGENGRPETWNIACAQLCGNSHYRMKGTYVVHTQEEYAAWLADNAPKPKAAPAAPAPAAADEEAPAAGDEEAPAAGDAAEGEGEAAAH